VRLDIQLVIAPKFGDVPLRGCFPASVLDSLVETGERLSGEIIYALRGWKSDSRALVLERLLFPDRDRFAFADPAECGRAIVHLQLEDLAVLRLACPEALV